jgi:hypothetical protein
MLSGDMEPRAEEHGALYGLAREVMDEPNGELAVVAVLHFDLDRLESVIGSSRQNRWRRES